MQQKKNAAVLLVDIALGLLLVVTVPQIGYLAHRVWMDGFGAQHCAFFVLRVLSGDWAWCELPKQGAGPTLVHVILMSLLALAATHEYLLLSSYAGPSTRARALAPAGGDAVDEDRFPALQSRLIFVLAHFVAMVWVVGPGRNTLLAATPAVASWTNSLTAALLTVLLVLIQPEYGRDCFRLSLTARRRCAAAYLVVLFAPVWLSTLVFTFTKVIPFRLGQVLVLFEVAWTWFCGSLWLSFS